MIKIYNTLTRKKEEFKPIVPGYVGMYVCGPTVYGPPHVGHARSYINFDTIIRFFRFMGFKVKYIQNITDVGHLTGDSDDGQDKILKQALLEKVDPYEIAYKYEQAYFDCMDKLNVARPSISCRATAFIPEMIDFVQELVDNGFGYVTKEGNVYFDVEKYNKYGHLSGRDLNNTKSGERIKVADDKKRPEDFALWKKAEPEHIMKWKSPWGVGYPGWHLECSAMSRKFLGKTFDIHGGGIDNMFPHHESEFAQSESINGCPFVNYFMHNNLITVNGTKMGKSLGNFITLEDLFKEFDPISVRWFILQFHYRSPVDFSKEALQKAAEQFGKVADWAASVRLEAKALTEPKTPAIKAIYNAMIAAMEEDFNTPVAIAEILKLIKIKENFDELAYINSNFLEGVLGLKFTQAAVQPKQKEIPAEIIKLAEERIAAKRAKNYAESDRIRAEIETKGFKITDTSGGYVIE